jgi:class 3 adenylate cyclase
MLLPQVIEMTKDTGFSGATLTVKGTNQPVQVIRLHVYE